MDSKSYHGVEAGEECHANPRHLGFVQEGSCQPPKHKKMNARKTPNGGVNKGGLRAAGSG